jgi:hypothetical protein
LHGLQGDHAGQLQEGHPHFKEHRLQGVVLGLGQVAAGLLRQHAQQINGCPRAQNVHPGTLALLCARAHLDHRGDVKLLHQMLEADRRLRAHGGVLRPHHLFQPLRRGVVGRLLFAALLGRGCGGNSPSAAASGLGSLTTSRGPPPFSGGADAVSTDAASTGDSDGC